jgi:hypothetical protein
VVFYPFFDLYLTKLKEGEECGSKLSPYQDRLACLGMGFSVLRVNQGLSSIQKLMFMKTIKIVKKGGLYEY